MKLNYDLRSKVRTFFGELYEMKVKGRLDLNCPRQPPTLQSIYPRINVLLTYNVSDVIIVQYITCCMDLAFRIVSQNIRVYYTADCVQY